MEQLLRNLNGFLEAELVIKGYKTHYKPSLTDQPARVLNNKIKKLLLTAYTKAHHHFLDLPCGSGNDIAKIAHVGIDRYVGIDLDYNDFLLGVARNRESTHRMPCQFFKSDMCADEMLSKLYIDLHAFDVVSCQFALHYAFESEKTANAFVKNVADALRDGGTFIATYPCGDRLLDAWKKLERPCVLRSEHFNITFPDTAPVRTIKFGQKYHFQLGEFVNDYEFLVSDAQLESICKRNGLHLVEKVDFSELCTAHDPKDAQDGPLLAGVRFDYSVLNEGNRALVDLYKYCVFLKTPV